MATPGIKDEAHRLVEQLREDSTWDDLLYAIYVRQAIEAGLDASRHSRTKSLAEVKQRFGLAG